MAKSVAIVGDGWLEPDTIGHIFIERGSRLLDLGRAMMLSRAGILATGDRDDPIGKVRVMLEGERGQPQSSASSR
jgi:hypothetical protein